jgi:HSP20 family protein
MDEFKKRRRRPFDGFDDFPADDIFDEFEEEMRRMQERMGQFFDDTVRSQDEGNFKRYVYGFSLQPGPDGRPIIEEFGNIPRRGQAQIPGEREPLVEVIDGKQQVTVIAELPGVDKKDIDLKADEWNLTISVDAENRKYYKELEMPAEIDPASIKATYKNGILEVKLNRKVNRSDTKRRIHIE